MRAVKVQRRQADASSNGNGSILRKLREEKGLSQRELAKKLGICKSSLVYFERKAFEDMTVRELKRLSKVFEFNFEELMLSNGSKKPAITRFSLEKPSFTLDYGEGVRINSHLEKPAAIFAGTLALGPYKTFPKEKAPRGDIVFYLILEGTLTVKSGSEECVLKEGETLALQHPPPYELYNPHQFKEVVAFFSTIPSFIQSPY